MAALYCRHFDHHDILTTLRSTAAAKQALDRLYDDFDQVDVVADPIDRVRAYVNPADREIAGFCAAALAYGRVAGVLKSIDALLAVMGTSPAAFVRRFDPLADGEALGMLTHRWTRGIDLIALMWILRRMLEMSGSIEAFFLEGYRRDAEDIAAALDSFCTRALAIDLDPIYDHCSRRRGVDFFFPKPSAGSGCKRLNLYLRWMVRCDRVDLGVWRRVDPSKLIVPLDTHVIRVGQCLQLTSYRSPSWSMAREISVSLRRFDLADPVKYDFSLCHLGMMNRCGFNRQQGNAQCPLRGLCRPARCKPRRSR